MSLGCLIDYYPSTVECYGENWFHSQHTTPLRAVDSESGEAHSFSAAKPFALLRNIDGLPSASSPTQHPGVLQEEALAGIQSVATVAKKRPISSDLLHRRLGHRTVNAMMVVGSRNEVWADTTMRWEHDDLCDSCQVVTARLSNCGKLPLDVGL